MNNTSQLLIDEFQANYPDLIGFAAIKETESSPCAVHLLSVAEGVDREALSTYLRDTLANFRETAPFTVERYLAHLDAKHIELGIVYQQMSFLFLSKKENINEVLLQEVCSDFCGRIYPVLHRSSSDSLHSFSNTFQGNKKTVMAELKPDEPTSATVDLLREQAGVRVDKRHAENQVSIAHYIAQKNLGQYAKQELLQARQHVLNHLDSQLVLSRFDFQGGQIKIERPFVMGRSMAELIQSRQKMQLTQALAIIRKLVDLLKPLHQNGFAHGNIHPHNVFFSPEREVLLTDDYLFDLITSPKFIQKSYSQESRIPVGRLGYLAPEQLLGELATPQSDFWSLGYLFCYLILGEPVLRFHTPSEQIVAAHHSIKEAIKERVLAYHPCVQSFLEGLIQQKPQQRFGDLSEILAQIVEIMAQQNTP